ncbi:hypothetical protein [Nocardioides montaniterrae]
MSGVIQSIGSMLKRPVAKTTPTLRTSAQAVVNNGSSAIVVTIPSSAVAGDFAVFFIGESSGTCDTPSGLTKVDVSQIGDTANQPYMHIYTRRLVAGDVSSDYGLSFTFNAGASDGLCGAVMVFANTSGFGVRPQFTFQAQTDVANSHTPAGCSLLMGPYDLFVGAAVTLAYVSAGLSNAQMATAPTGCTIDQTMAATRAAGTGGTCRGLAVFHGPTHAQRVESMTFNAQEWVVMATMTLAPIQPRVTDIDQVPPELLGVPVYNYSNSSGACVVYDQSDVTRGCNTYRPWPERVATACGAVNKLNDKAMGGARAADICTAAYGTATYTSVRAGSGNTAGQNNQYNPQALTQTALTNRLTALYTTDLVGNDFLQLGTGTQALTSARNAVDALLKLIRAATVNGSATGASYTGTWADDSSDGYLAGVAKKTTTPGDKVTISVTDKPAVDIVVIAHDSAAESLTGAAYIVKVDGTTVATGTTHNEHLATGVYNNYKFCQKVISVTGIPAGTHAITIEHAGATNDVLIYNGHMLPATTPPWIVTNKIWPLPAATYTTYGMSAAQAATYNQLVQDAADQFTDKRVLVYDPSASGVWDTGVHVSAGDGLHQSDLGHALYGHEIIRLLNRHLLAPSRDIVNPTSLAPSTIPSTWDLIGTRPFYVPTGVTSINFEGEGGSGGGGGGAAGGAGKGGGGGAYAQAPSVPVTPGELLWITVGAPGAGGAVSTAGTAGTVSKVVRDSNGAVLWKADCGTGGGTGLGAVGTGGLAANCVGTTKTSGSNGSTTTGGAGAAPLGGAAATYSGSGAGTAGNPPGGGGSGANPGNAGGPGARGVVKLS